MIAKLLEIELQYNSDIDDCEIIIRNGKILENKDFLELKNQMTDLKEKIVDLIKEELE